MSIFSENKTSARLLIDYAEEKWIKQAEASYPQQEKLFLILYDLYIKARSYAIINKVAFWLSILAGIMVFIWPSLAVISKDFGLNLAFFESAIVQTTVTGLAALTFAVYSHYKKRQLYVENLMRYVIYAEQPDQALVDKVLKEMEKIDTGFSFANTISKKDKD